MHSVLETAMKLSNCNWIVLTALALVITTPCVLQAQRLPTGFGGRGRSVLRGSRNPRIDTLVSEGRVDDAMRVPGMTFRFRPTHAQSTELEQFLDDLQDPASSLYHAWLTPEE